MPRPTVQKDIKLALPCGVKRIDGVFHAWPEGSGGSGAQGQGETEAEARADLLRNVQWSVHCVGIHRATTRGGDLPYLVSPFSRWGVWEVVRISTGAMRIVEAPSFSALCAELARLHALGWWE